MTDHALTLEDLTDSPFSDEFTLPVKEEKPLAGNTYSSLPGGLVSYFIEAKAKTATLNHNGDSPRILADAGLSKLDTYHKDKVQDLYKVLKEAADTVIEASKENPSNPKLPEALYAHDSLFQKANAIVEALEEEKIIYDLKNEGETGKNAILSLLSLGKLAAEKYQTKKFGEFKDNQKIDIGTLAPETAVVRPYN